MGSLNQQDALAIKSTCHRNRATRSHGGRKELIYKSCPLIFTCVPWHLCPHSLIHTHHTYRYTDINNNFFKKECVHELKVIKPIKKNYLLIQQEGIYAWYWKPSQLRRANGIMTLEGIISVVLTPQQGNLS